MPLWWARLGEIPAVLLEWKNPKLWVVATAVLLASLVTGAGLEGGWIPATKVPWGVAASVLAELREEAQESRRSRDTSLVQNGIGEDLSYSGLKFFWGKSGPHNLLTHKWLI